MTSLPIDPTDRLYALLPAVYRLRDVAAGEPLRALLSVIESELLTVENDITALYDNWFIETCAPWVVPYIGDLLDVRDLYADNPLTYGQQERRAYVANTLAYRRRKGTTPVLEQLTRDVTGWRSRAVEFSRLLLTTQQLNHVRSASATVNLRADHRLQQIGTPFEQQAAYSAEIRPGRQGGRYNLPNVGLFIWRLQNYPIQRGTARAVAGADPEPTGRYYTFNPLGHDQMPLFNQPQTETNIVNLAAEINVPGMLRNVVLANELNARHRALLRGEPLEGVRYFDRDPVLQLFINGQPNPIPAEEILICSLKPPESNPSDPTETEAEERRAPPWQAPLYEAEQSEAEFPFPTKVVAVDPELGRIAFLDTPLPRRVEVSYLYGFSDDVGGGPYPRSGAEQGRPEPLSIASQTGSKPVFISPLHWWIDPTTTADPNPLATAIHTWNQTTTAWEMLNDQASIPLATIQIPSVQVSQIDREKVRRFVPGMIGEGLQVIGRAGQRQVIITAGQAIDGQGRRLIVREDFSLDLGEFSFSKYPDRTDYPHCTGWLVTGYQSTAQKQSNSPRQRLPVQFVPEAALEGYSRGTFIPLARLTLDSDNRLIAPPEQQGRSAEFQPGILQGLAVQVRPGTLEAIVTPGTAVDSQGRPLMATMNQPLDLVPYQGETRLVIIRRDVRRSRRSPIELVRPDDPTLTAEQPYVLLASLDIPRVTVRLNPSFPSAPQPELMAPMSDAPALPTVEPSSSPIRVTVTQPDRAIVTVSAGTVMDGQQQLLTLEHDCQFDLSRYAAQTVILFISRHTDLGLPLDPISPPRGQSWEKLGLVPREPHTSDIGTIVLKGNQTYSGDLFLKLPATRRLTLIASEGSRPHVQGNLYVQGTASPDQEQPGELRVNGLLIEGHLTVLAGNLKYLQISHCTLVPQKGGLRVKKGRVITPPPPEDDSSWMALLMYGLSLIWHLIQQDWKLACATANPSTSSPRPLQLVQFALQQLAQLTSEIWETMQTWQCLEDSEGEGLCGWESDPSTLTQGNARLEILLERSICGSIYLADTVPKLTVVDSILDKAQAPSDAEKTSGTAIAAPGTEVEIQTSTVWGMSLVRSLEASNSLFTEKVTALRRQVGCIRFSHVPEGSQTPRRYQCQPDMALKQELDPLPEAITALGLAPQWAADDSDPPSPSAFLLLGTAGGGAFRFQNDRTGWEPLDAALPDRHITASLVYYQSGLGLLQSQGTMVTGLSIAADDAPPGQEAALTTRFTQQLRPGDRLLVAQQTRTVTAVLNDAELIVDEPFQEVLNGQPFHIHTLLIGTLGGTVFRYRDGGDRGASWTQVGGGQTNAPITTLLHTLEPGTGTLSGQGNTLTGVGTRFSTELQIGDAIALSPPATPGSPPNPTQTRQVVALGQPGTGTLSSQGTTVTGSNPEFASHLNPGDTLTALGHTRTVVRRSSDGSPTVEINTPFPTDLPPGTSFLRNIDTVLTVNAPFSQGSLPTTPFQIPRVYAATAGGGVLQARENGEQWQSINQGLGGLNVTTLAINPANGQLFAGTVGSGVWRFVKRDRENGIPDDRWMSANSLGLTHRNITALAIAPPNHLWAGTAGGGIFHSPVADPDWKAMNQGLTSLNITTLAIEATETTSDNLAVLFTGTSDGRLFRSMELSATTIDQINELASPETEPLWQPLSLDLQGIDITALAYRRLPPQTRGLWVGTATGEVLRSLDEGSRWQSMNHGLPNVAEKRQILDRLKPTFTSMQYGDPGYGQLSQSCIQEIRVGAEDGAEIGVFNSLKQPQREANLQASLEEYLRFGLEAGIFYVT